MMSFLKVHPFPVVARLERTVVVAYAVPTDELRALVPPMLEIDTFAERWGFIAVAMVRARALRPEGLPAWAGQDLWMSGYRVFVRYTNERGKRLRGLYILGSETDSRRLVLLGNLFTHYKYRRKELEEISTGSVHRIRSTDGSVALDFRDERDEAVPLPSGSPFKDWTEARRYVGPLPFTFSHDEARARMVIVEGSRTDWHPRPVAVEKCAFTFLDRYTFSERHLANAFAIDGVPYLWKRGVIEKLRR